jgi:nicotinamidase-related amidase
LETASTTSQLIGNGETKLKCWIPAAPKLAAMPELPVPPHFEPATVGEFWRVDYESRAAEARSWAADHAVGLAADDGLAVCLVLVDVQNTFCVPGFELFVGGRSGTGAVDDNRRLCEFIYRNLGAITQIVPTMDTHRVMQIFHAIWLLDPDGNHPAPYTLVSAADVEEGRWRVNPAVCKSVGIEEDYAQRQLLHYTRALEAGGKYNLTVWPYHAMLGGVGHALVAAVEEAVFFHSVARYSQPDFEVKGENPLTEHYSMLGPEVTEGPDGETIAGKNDALIEHLFDFDAVVVAGQAKSHCVAWTIADLLEGDDARERSLAPRTYLLEDCTSPVVVPGAVDYTDEADRAFRRFAEAGMHVVRSTEPMETWPRLGELLQVTSSSRSFGR